MNSNPIQIDIISGDKHIASFHYYDGIKEAKNRNLKQDTEIKQNTFIVSCGYVMFLVNKDEYPNTRKNIL